MDLMGLYTKLIIATRITSRSRTLINLVFTNETNILAFSLPISKNLRPQKRILGTIAIRDHENRNKKSRINVLSRLFHHYPRYLQIVLIWMIEPEHKLSGLKILRTICFMKKKLRFFF